MFFLSLTYGDFPDFFIWVGTEDLAPSDDCFGDLSVARLSTTKQSNLT